MTPYPNEVGLMRRFTEFISRNLKKVGGKFEAIKGKAKEIASKVKGLVRGAHLFANRREEKRKIGEKLYHAVEDLQKLLEQVTQQGYDCRTKGGKEIERLYEVMDRLMPQILYFLQTGFVAAK